MAWLTAEGCRFNVTKLGEGAPDAVCVHGLLLDNLSSFYYTLAPALSTQRAVHMYDLRGHGRSELTETGYGIDNSVDDLLAVLDGLGLDEPVHLIGNSFGGFVSLRTAIDHPDRVASLTLIEAHFAVEGWDTEMVDGLRLLANQAAADAEAEGPDRTRRVRSARHADGLVHGTSLLDDLRGTSPVTGRELASITCPVLAFYGADSGLRERGTDLRTHVADCELHLLPGATHYLLFEETGAVAEGVLPHLSAADGDFRAGAVR